MLSLSRILDLTLSMVSEDASSRNGLDEDLHATTQAQDEMQGGLLLNVVVGQGAAVLKLLASEDETRLVGESWT
jgi:hypothetical protein